MKKVLFTIAALFCTTLSFAQEYMIVESNSGQYATFPVSQIKQVFFYTKPQAQEATCAEIIAGEDGVTYRVRGEVTSIDNTLYGNWYLKDETGEIYIYGTLDANGQTKNFESLGIAVGDIVTVEGPKKTYNETIELVNVTVIKIEKPVHGSGTETDPYNVAAVLQITKALADGEVINDVYTQGYICRIDQIDTQGAYGNAVYWICDDPNGNNERFEVYRGYGLNGQKFNEEGATLINIGDLVTIKGNVKNFKGTTPEYDQGSIIVNLQPAEQTDENNDTPNGDGTLVNPFNATAAANLALTLDSKVASTNSYYIKGIISSIRYTFSAQYGTAVFDISNDGSGNTTQFTCYSIYYFGNQPWIEGNAQIKVGDEVIVYGQIINWAGVAETAEKKAYLYSLNGKTSEGGGGGDAAKGTKENPYNVAEALAAINALADNGYSDAEVYVKGKVVKVTTTQANFEKYGNLNYLISDDGTESNTVTVYSGDGLNGAKFTGIDAIKQGDEVIVYGKLQKYVKNDNVTPEIAKGNYLVSLVKAGSGGGDTPSGDAQAVTIAQFNAAAVSTDVWYQLTGTIKNLQDGDQYGNFDIEDETGSVYVYGLLATKGGEKKKFQDLVTAKGIANGKKITIIGNRGEYNSTAQVANAYFVKIEDGEGGDGGDTPSGDTDGSEAKPYTVAAAIAAGSGTSVFTKAYIVGWIEGQVLSDGAHFNGEATVASNILIADSPDETDVTKCMPVQLPSGAVRTAVNLKDNPGNYKKEIILVGNIEKYFGATGIKGASYAKIGDTEAGTKPEGGEGSGGGDTPSGEGQAVTIAQFNAAAVSTDVWYQLTGTIKNLKDGDKYGNFDIEDATGSVYVYGLLSEKGGAKQKFQELVTAKGIANGKKITIIGNRGAYNDKIEVLNAYFVSIQ